MKRKIRRGYRKFKRYMEETLANKIMAIILILIGMFTNYILDDGTFLIFMLMFGGYMFFTPENCLYHEEES